MPVTVKGMIENFLSMVERFGFVPNGGRVYYLSRSQPPLLIPMVRMTSSTPFEYKAHFSIPVSELVAFRGNSGASLCAMSLRLPLNSSSKNSQFHFCLKRSLPGREVLRLHEGSRVSEAKYSRPRQGIRILAKREDGDRNEERCPLQDGALRDKQQRSATGELQVSFPLDGGEKTRLWIPGDRCNCQNSPRNLFLAILLHFTTTIAEFMEARSDWGYGWEFARDFFPRRKKFERGETESRFFSSTYWNYVRVTCVTWRSRSVVIFPRKGIHISTVASIIPRSGRAANCGGYLTNKDEPCAYLS